MVFGIRICPISKFRNNIYVLLGQERFNNQWSDFGGSRNGNETPYQTACREGYEELDGFLGSEQDIKNLVNTHNIVIFTNQSTLKKQEKKLIFIEKIKNIISDLLLPIKIYISIENGYHGQHL